MLDVRRLRLLRELRLRGTIAAVAEALMFTPSAVSQQLTALEREAGTALLHRTGRTVTLTPAGARLVARAEEVLAVLEQAEGELAEARDEAVGPVRIGAFPSAGPRIVAAALAQLAASHPRLEPSTTEIDPAAVPQALRAGELDIALVHEYDFVPAPAEAGLASVPLCEEPVFLASSTAVPVPEAEGLSPTLAELPWITATPGTLCARMTERACQAAGFTPRVRHRMDDFAAVLALIDAGQGVALVPHLATGGAPSGVSLTSVGVRRRTRVAFRAGGGRHPAVRAVVGALRGAVPRELGV